MRTSSLIELRSGPALGSLAVALLAVVLLAQPGVGGASTPTGASFTFSGAASGHLTTPASDCSDATAQSGEIDFYHSLKGHAGNEWSLFYNDHGSGTYKKFGLTAAQSFSTEINSSISESWTAKSGSFTVKGKTGSANMVLKPQIGSSTRGLLRVKGTWNCP
ncbi:MAG: hypothetical protein ACLPVF_17130 [Acidimicrobiales bacterium]